MRTVSQLRGVAGFYIFTCSRWAERHPYAPRPIRPNWAALARTDASRESCQSVWARTGGEPWMLVELTRNLPDAVVMAFIVP